MATFFIWLVSALLICIVVWSSTLINDNEETKTDYVKPKPEELGMIGLVAQIERNMYEQTTTKIEPKSRKKLKKKVYKRKKSK